MTDIVKKKRGRPVGSKGNKTATKQLPRIRVTEDQLNAYREASGREGKSLSKWAKDLMDEASLGKTP